MELVEELDKKSQQAALEPPPNMIKAGLVKIRQEELDRMNAIRGEKSEKADGDLIPKMMTIESAEKYRAELDGLRGAFSGIFQKGDEELLPKKTVDLVQTHNEIACSKCGNADLDFDGFEFACGLCG